MESLQMMKFSIRKGRSLTFTEGMSWVDELHDIELSARTAPINDAEAYGRSLESSDEDSDDMEEVLDKLRKDMDVEEQEEEDEDEELAEEDTYDDEMYA
jgi:hypothetical protein